MILVKYVSSFIGSRRLNAWARWALARGPYEHRGPILIYECCDLLPINNYYAVLNYKYVLLYHEWTLAFPSDVISPSPLQPHVYVRVRISTVYMFIPVGGFVGRGPRAPIMLLRWPCDSRLSSYMTRRAVFRWNVVYRKILTKHLYNLFF